MTASKILSEVNSSNVAAMRWTRQLSSGATSTSSRRCSTTSHRQSTRGWSGRPYGGESGSSAKAGVETKSQRWRRLVSTKDTSSIISRKATESDFRVSTSLRRDTMIESERQNGYVNFRDHSNGFALLRPLRGHDDHPEHREQVPSRHRHQHGQLPHGREAHGHNGRSATSTVGGGGTYGTSPAN